MRKCLLIVAVLALGSMASAQSINMNWTDDARPKGCADLKISSDDMKVARAEQKFTIAPSQAGLELNGAKNGGVRVYGWDNPNYEVIACKAAWAESDGEAQQVLASLNVTQQGTAINTTSANGENRHWTVMYLVHVPHEARLKATAYNGPMSVDDVDGTVNVSSHNGPVHVKRCKGEITAETVNGPVAFTGTGGNVNLKTTNGPLKLELEGARWSGSLNAETRNGPLSLQVPENFESAFLLEGSHSPVRCRGAICDKVQKSGERESRRLEYGTSPLIKGTTTNGPITVEVLRANL